MLVIAIGVALVVPSLVSNNTKNFNYGNATDVKELAINLYDKKLGENELPHKASQLMWCILLIIILPDIKLVNLFCLKKLKITVLIKIIFLSHWTMLIILFIWLLTLKNSCKYSKNILYKQEYNNIIIKYITHLLILIFHTE